MLLRSIHICIQIETIRIGWNLKYSYWNRQLLYSLPPWRGMWRDRGGADTLRVTGSTLRPGDERNDINTARGSPLTAPAQTLDLHLR